MGKGLNPADAYRKVQRQKELKKAKEKRQLQQEVSALLNDPNKIDEEIKNVQKQSDENRLDNALKNRLKELQQMKTIALKKQQQAKLLNKPVVETNTTTPNSTMPIQSYNTGSDQSARNVPIIQLNYGSGNVMGGINGIPLPPPRPIMGGINGIPLPPPRPMPNQVPYNNIKLHQQIQNKRNNVNRSIPDPLDPSNKSYYAERPIQHNQSDHLLEEKKWDKWDTSGYEENQLVEEPVNHTEDEEEEQDNDADYEEDVENCYDLDNEDVHDNEENIKHDEKVEIRDHHKELQFQPFFGALNMPKPLSAEELLKRRNATVINSSYVGPSIDTKCTISTNALQKIVEEDNSKVLTSLFGSYGDDEDDTNNLIIPLNDSFLAPQNDIKQQLSDKPNKLKVIKAEAGIKALVPNVLRFKRGLTNPFPFNKKLKSSAADDVTVSKAASTNSVDDAYLSFMNEIKDVI